MVLSRLLPTLILLGCSGAHGFEMDLSPAEARAKLSIFAVSDLMVGDSGRLRSLTFCTRDGALFVPADAQLTDYKSTYSFIVTREPENALSLTAKVEQSASSAEQTGEEAYQALSRSLIYALNTKCDDTAMPISSVGGETSLSELLTR